MRGLKTLVIVMGVMLMVGVAALAVTMAVRLSHRVPGSTPAAFTAPPITLPHGAKIEMMSNGPDRILLEIALADGSAELVVIDLATGQLIGIIPLREGP
jgi:hypothetical protein